MKFQQEQHLLAHTVSFFFSSLLPPRIPGTEKVVRLTMEMETHWSANNDRVTDT